MYVFIGGCICGFCVIRALSGWVLCSMMGVRFFVLFGWLCMCLALGTCSGNLTGFILQYKCERIQHLVRPDDMMSRYRMTHIGKVIVTSYFVSYLVFL